MTGQAEHKEDNALGKALGTYYAYVATTPPGKWSLDAELKMLRDIQVAIVPELERFVRGRDKP